FGWFSPMASSASCMNISTKRGSVAACGRMRLITTLRAARPGPCSRPRKISAMPPRARRPRLSKRPKRAMAGSDRAEADTGRWRVYEKLVDPRSFRLDRRRFGSTWRVRALPKVGALYGSMPRVSHPEQAYRRKEAEMSAAEAERDLPGGERQKTEAELLDVLY